MRQRLVEGWLPLAQDMNQQYGWQLDGSALEALIITAMPALADAHSALAARAVFWQLYHRHARDDACASQAAAARNGVPG
jgi:hypothetical protein